MLGSAQGPRPTRLGVSVQREPDSGIHANKLTLGPSPAFLDRCEGLECTRAYPLSQGQAVSSTTERTTTFPGPDRRAA